MERTFRDSLNDRLKDPHFRAEWEALETERQINIAIIEGRPLTGFTPEQIAEARNRSEADAAYKVAVKAVDQAVARGLLHRNKATNKKSKMTVKPSRLA